MEGGMADTGVEMGVVMECVNLSDLGPRLQLLQMSLVTILSRRQRAHRRQRAC